MQAYVSSDDRIRAFWATGILLGGTRHGRCTEGCSSLTAVAAARVVPSVPAFSVDDGFWYQIPDEMRVEVGSVVRVPLGGRRVRGFVIDTGERDDSRLRAISAVSGRATVFDGQLLESMRWAAHHYVAPLSIVLERCVPPNVPPAPPALSAAIGAGGGTGGPFMGPGRRVRAIAGSVDAVWRYAGDLSEIVMAGKSVLIVLPSLVETERVAAELRPFLGDALEVVQGDMDAKSVTAAWRAAAHRPTALVSTPRTALWKIHNLGLAIVVEDGRRAMKDRQTPTIHARDILAERSLRQGFNLVALGPVPTPESVAAAGSVVLLDRRAWPHVEVVDRRVEPPGSGLLGTTARQAIQAVTREGGDVFVYGHRRGYAAATRCGRCRTMRKCPTCGSRPDPGTECSRCGAPLGPCEACGLDRFEPLGAGVGRLVEDVRRLVARDSVAAAPETAAVTVGTERDLLTLTPRRLSVLVDLDGLILGPNYRASEEALRIAARLAASVSRGGRLLVQTHMPDHPVVVALRSGDPRKFLMPEVATRREMGYPPAGELMVVEIRGDIESDTIDADISSIRQQELIMGPASGRSGTRWLVQSTDLSHFKSGLRPLVQRWRESGGTVRIDADPIDL